MRIRPFRPFLVASAITLGLSLSATHASAALLTYTDRATFESALTSSFANDFQSLAPGSVASPQSFSGNGFSYQVAAAGGFFAVSIGGDVSLAPNAPSVPLTVGSFGGGVRAFGAYVYFNSGAAIAPSASGSITANNGIDPAASLSISAPTSQTTFVGFISTSGDLVSISMANSGGPGFPNLDDVVVGNTSPVTGVPEPTTFALVSMGLMGVGMLRRKL